MSLDHDPGRSEAPSIKEDKIKGVKQIAEFINEPERRTGYMLEQNQIPGWKIGRIWYSSRTALRECFTPGAA